MSLKIQAAGTFDTPVLVEQTAGHDVVDSNNLQLKNIFFI
jgi:hypothetical protein